MSEEFQSKSDQPRVGSSSPWGAIDSVVQIGPGIVQVNTPSHGGIWVAQHLRPQIDDRWLGGNRSWFEEDCEWAVVCHSFPESFKAFHDRRHGEGDVHTGDEVVAMADRSLRAWMPDAYEVITGQRVMPGESHHRDALEFARARPEGLWLGAAFGDWHGLVPKGLVGAFADVGNAATLMQNGGGVPARGIPEQVRILVPEAQHEAARSRHGWLGNDGIDAYEPWPGGGITTGLYCPLDSLRAIRLRGQSDEEALRTLASHKPGIAAVLYAKDGNFERATELLQADFGDSALPRNAVLWLAARAGEGKAVLELLSAGADPAWENQIAARAAAFHGHHNEVTALDRRIVPATARSAGPSL